MAEEPEETKAEKPTENKVVSENPEPAIEAEAEKPQASTEPEKPAELSEEAEADSDGEAKPDDQLKESSEEKKGEVEKPKDTPEKRKKSFLAKLTSSGKEEKADGATKKYDANSDGYVSAREAINSLNPEMIVETPSDDEVIAQEVAKQLEEQASYFVIRVKKSKLLLTLGLTVLILWLVPLTWFLQEKYDFNLGSYITEKQWQATPLPSQEPTLESVRPLIRIRAVADDEWAASAAARLAEAGYQTDNEALTDGDVGVSVAVRTGQLELQNQLITILLPIYPLATGSAVTLAQDSEVEALIVIGK